MFNSASGFRFIKQNLKLFKKIELSAWFRDIIEICRNSVFKREARLDDKGSVFRLPRCSGGFLFFLGIADGAFAPEAWVGNGVPTLRWNHVVSLQSRLSVFRGRDDHAPFFLSLRHGGSA